MRKWITLVESALDDALDNLVAHAKAKGMHLRLGLDGNVIDLEMIMRGDAPKGSGAQVMRELCAVADLYGKKIELYAFAADEGLVDYYRRFGFDVDQEKNDEAWLVRLPK